MSQLNASVINACSPEGFVRSCVQSGKRDCWVVQPSPSLILHCHAQGWIASLANQVELKVAIVQYHIQCAAYTGAATETNRIGGRPRERGWLRLSSFPIHPSIPPSGLRLCGYLSSCSFCTDKNPSSSATPSPPACCQCQLRTGTAEVPWTWGRNMFSLRYTETGRSVGTNLERTEHVVLCGSAGLITGVIKWAKLDRPGFGVKYTRLWFLCGLGWDNGWQFMAGDGINSGGKCTTL